MFIEVQRGDYFGVYSIPAAGGVDTSAIIMGDYSNGNDGVVLKGIDPRTSFESFDAVVIVTDHKVIERERLLSQAKLVVDTRDALRNVPGDRSKVYGL